MTFLIIPLFYQLIICHKLFNSLSLIYCAVCRCVYRYRFLLEKSPIYKAGKHFFIDIYIYLYLFLKYCSLRLRFQYVFLCTLYKTSNNNYYNVRGCCVPVSTRRFLTSITLKQRRLDIKTTSCVYWGVLPTGNRGI